MTARPTPLGLTADFAALTDLFAAAQFTDATRLYAFVGDGLPDLLVECFCGVEAVCSQGAGALWVVDVLSMQAGLPIRGWRFKQAALGIRQADGTTSWRSGYLQTVQQLDADGGLARYRLTLVPGIWLATQARRNRVFQNQPILQVVEAVLAPYAPYVRLQYDTGVDTALAGLPPRPMIVQYQESDHAFVTRLLAEEGLGWVTVEAASSGDAPDFSAGAAHVLQVFADAEGFSEDASSQAGGGVRWHRAGSQEASDAVFDWRQARTLRPNQTATLSWAWQHKRARVAVEPSASRPPNVPQLEVFSDAHDGRQLTQDDATRYARLRQTQLDSSQWQIGCASTLRSLRPHSWFDLVNYTEFSQGDLGTPSASDADRKRASQFNVLAVLHAGINNLPRQSQDDVARSVALLAGELVRTPPHPALPQAGLSSIEPLLPPMLARLAATGYANCAQLLPRNLPVQPWLPRQPHVAAGFTLPARVVGPQGETTPGNEEIHADATNRVRVAFFWQTAATDKHCAGDHSTCWVPVLQRAAGPTRGVHLLPRIGQEVLVGFLHGQLDQPVVLASAYNGRGEGSRLPQEDRAGVPASESPFAQSVDARIAGQGNRVGGGNSPAWHGAAGADHNHAAALLGLRSKEWGGLGFNQLLFDDSDQQLAVQVATTQYTSQVNLGHLRHRADNYRGSLRGTGFELRTDAYASVRAKQGVLLTTWGKDAATPTGDAAAAMRLYQTAADTGRNLSQAAGTHQTLRFAADAGVLNGNLAALREDKAPLAALAHAISGMVDGKDRNQALSDANNQYTGTASGKVPHTTDPLLTVAGRGGIGLTATEVQFASGQTHTEIAGAHHFTGVAGQTRIHSGQGIGMLGGAIQAANGIGLELIAGNGDILAQAQSDTLTVASQQDMTIAAGQAIDFAAAKRIVISTAAGACIEIGSNGIKVTAPGAFTVHAAGHEFVSGGGGSYSLPALPQAALDVQDRYSHAFDIGSMLQEDPGLEGTEYQIWTTGNTPKLLAEGVIDQIGRTVRVFTKEPQEVELIVGDNDWLAVEDAEYDDIEVGMAGDAV